MGENGTNRKIPTKERIVDAAFELFSAKGYDGVGVDQIAEYVGIKGPSLYHHFKSKEEILGALVARNEDYYNAHFGMVAELKEFPESIEGLINMSMERIRVTVRDEYIKKSRKFLIMEQFHNDKMRTVATKYFLTGLEELYTVFFENMMNEGKMLKDDPRMLAFEFVAPITMLVHQIDREPDKEEELLDKIEQFMRHLLLRYEVK